MKIIEGDFATPKGRFAIVAGRFNGFVVEPLVAGARDALVRHGVKDDAIELIRVPGAWEIALAAHKLANSGKYAAVIALGAVIRGSTPHFDFVAGECAKGLAQAALQLRRAGGVRRADHRQHRAGDRALGHQGRQQGCRRSDRRAGNGQPVREAVMSQHPQGIDLAARSRARRRALQALYAWQMSGSHMNAVIDQFRHEQDMEVADLEYFEDLLHGVENNVATLDECLRPHIDREVAQIDPIERAALRLAAYELKFRPDVPYRVVINEAIEVTKRFGADHGHSYVNGVLDKLAVDLRSVEKQHGR